MVGDEYVRLCIQVSVSWAYGSQFEKKYHLLIHFMLPSRSSDTKGMFYLTYQNLSFDKTYLQLLQKYTKSIFLAEMQSLS